MIFVPCTYRKFPYISVPPGNSFRDHMVLFYASYYCTAISGINDVPGLLLLVLEGLVHKSGGVLRDEALTS